MKLDITAFGLGALALVFGVLALWVSMAEVHWLVVGRALPIVLIVIGIVMLILSRLRTR
jgi:hypothetical protein